MLAHLVDLDPFASIVLCLAPRDAALLAGAAKAFAAAVRAELPRLAAASHTPQARSLEGVQVASLLRSVPSCDVFFERASDVIREDCEAALKAIAELLLTHRRCKLFASGHCGRGCPADFAPIFTRMRALSALENVVQYASSHSSRARLLLDPSGGPRLFYWGCAASVCARDIAYARQLDDRTPRLDFSKAELRIEFRGDSDEIEWGRRWWEAQPNGAPALNEPGWHAYEGSRPRELTSLSDEEEEDAADVEDGNSDDGDGEARDGADEG